MFGWLKKLLGSLFPDEVDAMQFEEPHFNESPEKLPTGISRRFGRLWDADGKMIQPDQDIRPESAED